MRFQLYRYYSALGAVSYAVQDTSLSANAKGAWLVRADCVSGDGVERIWTASNAPHKLGALVRINGGRVVAEAEQLCFLNPRFIA